MQQEVVYARPPSAVRGWFKRLGGMLTFNRRAMRAGKNEIEVAHAYQDVERDRRRGHRSRSRHRYGNYEADNGYQRERHYPFFPFSQRSPPPYQGAHLRFWGFLTRRKDHLSRGLQMAEEAERERRRARRRRLRRLQAEGLAIRMGAHTVIHPDHERSHRHRSDRHRSHHRSRSTPVVVSADPAVAGQGVVTTQAIPVARSTTHSRHRHHSSTGTTVPLVRSSSSRHGHHHRSRSRGYSGAAASMPVVQVASSHAPPVTISRAPSSRRGYAADYYENTGGVVPVMHSSSSRNGHSSRHPSLSRSHGHHSRAPTDVYVAA